MDEEGFFYLTDRSATDLIISGGVNIYPAEGRGLCWQPIPSVADAATIGIPDAEGRESVLAVVELPSRGRPPGDDLAAELISFCRSQPVADFKCPRSIDFRTHLPRTDGGKLYKRLLRDEYWAAAERNV